MRILHLVRTVSPESGGVIEALLQLAKTHQDLGHPAEVASLDPAEADYLDYCPLKLYAIGAAHSGTFGKHPPFTEWLKQHHSNYDAVISHGLWQYHGVAARQALADTQTPYYIFPHGMLDPYFHKAYPTKYLKKWLYWKLAEGANLSKARAVLFTCEEECNVARNAFKPYRIEERITGLGIQAPTVDPQAEVETFLEANPVLQGKPFLLFLGRLHNKKGVDLLIKAFIQCKEKATNSDLKLAIVGPCADAAYYQSLQEMSKPSSDIHFIDMLKGNKKWGAYAAAEAMILPSHQENFGLVVPEALACRTPVLISNKVNIWREVEKGGGGIIAEDTLEGTVELIDKWMAQSDEEKTKMREQAYPCFLKNFEIKSAAQRLVDTLVSDQ